MTLHLCVRTAMLPAFLSMDLEQTSSVSEVHIKSTLQKVIQHYSTFSHILIKICILTVYFGILYTYTTIILLLNTKKLLLYIYFTFLF